MKSIVRSFTGMVFFATVSWAGVVYTCDPSVDATNAGTCAYLNSAVSGLYGAAFTDANANIYIQQGATALATNAIPQSFIPYSTYVDILASKAGSSGIDADALAALNSLDAAVYGSDNVVISGALAGALGFTTIGGLTASGANCIIGSDPGCYSGIITITTPGILNAEQPGQSLYYRQNGSSITSDAYDYYSLVEHETNQILGIFSCVSTGGPVLTDACDRGVGASLGTGTPSAADLFRYNSAGQLAVNNAYLGLASAPAGAYFSYNGGVTNGADGAVYNTAANNQEYAGFAASCMWVQDANSCLGKSIDITADGNAEIHILDALGYTAALAPVPEPGTILLFATGLTALGAFRRFRR